MKLSIIRARRPRRLFVLPKRYVALPAALLCVCALCLLTTLPASVTTAAPERQLPIYCVQRDQKMVSLTFDAAWGNEDTQTLIDILDHYHVKATFFVVGNQGRKELIRRTPSGPWPTPATRSSATPTPTPTSTPSPPRRSSTT